MAQRGTTPGGLGAFGPNAWLVDEMYQKFRRDPSLVSSSWREFFADYRDEGRPGGGDIGPGDAGPGDAGPGGRAPGAVLPVQDAGPPGAPAALPAQVVPAGQDPEAESAVSVLRGAGARTVVNMEASLGVPTATSIRSVPAKLLEVNRKILNGHLARSTGGKVSFTHLIAYAAVQAMVAVPAMRKVFVRDDQNRPAVMSPEHIGLGLAVDVERADGSRVLTVPCVRDADTLGFRDFLLAYEDLVRKVRAGKASPDDFAGTTATITNPGTLGTEHSVPRLMAGQSVILGVGAIGYPAELHAADPSVIAQLGISKVITLTSTYDHRVIQGAESGLFLSHISKLLMGEHDFYDKVLQSMGVPYEPARWRPDNNRVDQEWGHLEKAVHVQTLINMYRVRGHLMADLDPLRVRPPSLHPELDPISYGLTVWDLDREFVTGGLAGEQVLALGEILGILRDAYCRTVGVEYMHIQEPDQKRWIQDHVEGVSQQISTEGQRHILDRLNAAEAFERFLHSRYIGQKRFGLEGAEAAIPLLDAILDEAAKEGMVEAVMGMAHRGRLNVLASIVGKSYGEIFREFEGELDPDSVLGSGDVKYHKGATGKFVGESGEGLLVTLASNPSHLEAVDPVVEGMARAKQDLLDDGTQFRVLSLLVHGDAAFAGQGVVAETLNLSALRGYRTGGTIHVVINNQLGFTTAPAAGRSSVYPTDIAKMVQAPIFHVNGDDPEACVRVGRLAVAFRQAFHKDVVIDMVCYRRHGHNEGDEPSYTQPKMYAEIERKRSVRKLYTEALVNRGDITIEEAEAVLEDFSARLQAALDETRSAKPPQLTGLPPEAGPARPLDPIDTGVEQTILDRVVEALNSHPEGFKVHPKLDRQLEARARMYEGGEVDWALAESLAFGSLMLEGTDVRLAGQDTRRGTFSQRHAVLVDFETEAEYVPLAGLASPGRFRVYDSLLSEYAALGFEYGYSVVREDALVLWEAQFGDFVNVGQVVVDEFVVAAEEKWGQPCSLVLLLPHGYEGQGPDHSSARLERFLALAAEGNMTVVNATTAAQEFHLLRGQAVRTARHPLVLFTPKSLLRARPARSRVGDLMTGHFLEVLDDPATTGAEPRVAAAGVRRVVICSGKVAYDAMARRDALLADQVDPASAVVRVEQLYPWPEQQIDTVLRRYDQANEVVWLQEEPENMGAWTFVHGRLHRVLRDRYTLRHVSRRESASPATGVMAMHQLETEDLMARAVG